MQGRRPSNCFRTTWLLLILVCTAAVFIILSEMRPAGPRDPDLAGKLLPGFSDDIDLIRLHNVNLTAELSRQADRWEITAPIHARAAGSAINRILAVLEDLPRLETVTAEQRRLRDLTLEDYGLATPRMRIVIESSRGQQVLDIGRLAPLRDAVYVRVDNRPEIIATATNLLQAVPASLDDLRDTRLVTGESATVTDIEIRRAPHPMIKLSQEAGEWIIRRPVLARANRQAVNDLLENIFSLRIARFVSETMADPISYGLNDEDAILQFTLLHGNRDRSLRCLFGKRVTGSDLVFAGIHGASAVYAVPAAKLENLRCTLNELRDRRLYCMPPAKVNAIAIETGSSRLQMHRDAGQWRIVAPLQARADNAAVMDFLHRINTLQIEDINEIADQAHNGIEQPVLTIRLDETIPAPEAETAAIVPETRTRILIIGRRNPDTGTVPARFEGEPQVMQLSAAATAGISADPADYRTRSVLNIDAQSVTMISFATNGVVRSLQRDATGAWNSTPEAYAVDQPAVDLLLRVAGNLQAMRFERLPVAEPAIYGLQTPRLAATFTVTGTEGIRRTIFFGKPTDDRGVFAMIQGQTGVFVVDQASFRAFAGLAQSAGRSD